VGILSSGNSHPKGFHKEAAGARLKGEEKRTEVEGLRTEHITEG
jgi:hypothetical protein